MAIAHIAWLWLTAVVGIPALPAQEPPSITTQPAGSSLSSGSIAEFAVSATGDAPLRYQWRVNGTNFAGATTATLSLTNISFLNGGAYQVVVTNNFGATTSAVAMLMVDEDLTFRLTELLPTSARWTEHNNLTGDDRGGIAISPNYVLVNGDNRAARLAADTLANGLQFGSRLDALCGNLRDETVYTLANGNTPILSNPFNFNTVNSLLEVDPGNGSLSGRRIDLSTNVAINSSSMVFSGWDRIVIYNGSRLFHIALPSGRVLDLGAQPSPNRNFSESWASWGIAEYVNNTIFLVYVQDSQTIARRRAGANTATILNSFESLSDMASITFSPSRGRWFFHHEGSSQFTANNFPDEVVGSAKGSFTTDANYPLILTNPVSHSVYIDSNTVFRVAAAGGAFLEYQWFFNGMEIPGATAAQLELTNIQPANAGIYTVRISNPSGSLVSSPATLSVITTPFLVSQPASRSVFRGSNTVFSALADGAPRLAYEWRFNGAPLPGATNSSLFLTNVQPSQSGMYTVRVSNRFGFAESVQAELFVATVVDDGSVFQVTSLVTNGAKTVNGWNLTDYAVGSIALSASNLFYTGFDGTGRFAAENLGNSNLLSRTYQALVSNLRTEQVYTLGEGATPLGEGGTATTLLEVDGLTGELTGARIDLSAPVPALNVSPNFETVGLFSGFDRIVIHNNSHVYNIALPSGRVTDLGFLSARQHNFSQGWGHWGIAEHINGLVYLLYFRDNRTVVRTRVPDGLTTTVVQFPNTVSFYLSAMTVSIRRNRWYFEYPFGGSTFQSFAQTVGYANAAFDVNSGPNIDHFEWDPVFPVQSVNVPFPVRLTARTTSGNIASNFNGVVRLSGRDAATDAPVSVLPISVSAFTNGVWVGEVSVLQPAPGVFLRADDGNGNSGDSGIFSVSPTNDIVVQITDSPDPVILGRDLTYTISVTNTGPADATGVTLSNALPTNVVFVAVHSSRGSCSNMGNFVLCDLGTVPSGLRVEVLVTVTPTVLGSISAHASVTRAEPDPDTSNNSATAVTLVSNPAIRISDLVVTEGDSGTNFVDFEVTLNSPSTNTVRVNFLTGNGTAAAPLDFVPRSGTVIFPPGSTNQTVSIGIRGDISYETNETFFVNLSSPQNATLADNQGMATILNDDAPPLVSISDVSVIEGNSGTNNASFRVGLSAPNGLAVVVRYTTSNGTARAGSDYNTRSGTITFTPGTPVLTQTLTIQIRGDTLPESNEIFYVNLTSATNAVIGKAQGIGTIVNDESSGTFDRFGWSTISSPQSTGTPVLVTVRAQDFYGNTITDFNGSVAFRGAIGQPQIEGTLVPPNTVHDNTEAGGPYTFGLDFTPTVDMTVTHIRHYSGNKVSIWTEDGALIASQNVTGTAGSWTETPLNTPVPLQANTTYRVAHYTGTDNYYWSTNVFVSFDHGSIGESFYSFGDAFPNNNLGQSYWMSDLRYTIGAPSVPVAVSPAGGGPFTNGVWSGYVTILAAAENMHLEADDGQGRVGLSNPFDAMGDTNANLAIRISGTNFVHTGSNVVLVITVSNRGPASASAIVVSNDVPGALTFVSASSSQGPYSNAPSGVLWYTGSLPPRSAATSLVTYQAGATGRAVVSASATAAETDPYPLNNRASFSITVYLDSDSDGIWDEWETANGFQPHDPGDASLDTDADGHSNLQEFHAGTNPRNRDSVKLLTAILFNNGMVHLRFRGAAGDQYRIEFSDDLTAWHILQDGIAGTEAEFTDTLPPGAKMRSYRASRLP